MITVIAHYAFSCKVLKLLPFTYVQSELHDGSSGFGGAEGSLASLQARPSAGVCTYLAKCSADSAMKAMLRFVNFPCTLIFYLSCPTCLLSSLGACGVAGHRAQAPGAGAEAPGPGGELSSLKPCRGDSGSVCPHDGNKYAQASSPGCFGML